MLELLVALFHTMPWHLSSPNNIVDGSDMSRLQFLNTGTGQVALNQSTAQCLIVSPKSFVSIQGGFTLYGGIVASGLQIEDTSQIHQDLHIPGSGSGSGNSNPIPDAWTRVVQ